MVPRQKESGVGGEFKLRILTQRNPHLVIAAATVIPRVALYGVATSGLYGDFGGVGHDGYLQIAQSLVAAGVYGFDGVHSIATRAPMEPILLIPGVLMGAPMVWALLIHTLLSVFAAWNVFDTARTLGAPDKGALISALALTLNPWFIWFTKNPMTYVVATFLMSCIVRALASCHYKTTGFLCGLATMCHPGLTLTMFGAIGWIFVMDRRARKYWCCLALLLACGITGAPWIVRNFLVTNRLIPTVEGAGFQYFIGQSIYETGHLDLRRVYTVIGKDKGTIAMKYFTLLDDRDNVAFNRAARRDFFKTAVTHPLLLAKRMLFHTWAFWFWDTLAITRAGHLILMLPLFGCAFCALIRQHTRRRAIALSCLVGPVVAINALVTGVIPHAAYSIPLLPVVVLGLALLTVRPHTMPSPID